MFLTPIFSRARSRGTGRPATFQPQLEALEARWCPSAIVTQVGSTLEILALKGTNSIAIEQKDRTNDPTDPADSLQVIDNGVTSNFTSSSITQIQVTFKKGAGDFTYDLVPGSEVVFDKQVVVNLGPGNKQAMFDFRGRNGIAFPIRAGLNISVFGSGKGSDTIIGNFGAVAGGHLAFTGRGASGNNQVRANLWGRITGASTVSLDLEGGRGNNALSTFDNFDLASGMPGGINVSGDSSLSITMNGGRGNNDLGATYDGPVSGQFNLLMNGGPRRDTLDAEIGLEPGSDGTFNGALFGRPGGDHLTFNLTNNSGGTVHIARALLVGGKPGHNTATATANVTVENVP